MLCGNLSGIQIVRDGGIGFTRGDALEYLPDNGGLVLVDLILAISALAVAERDHGDNLALHGCIHQAALDVLGHVLAVELVDVHHGAQGEASSGVVTKFFFRIYHAHAHLRKFILIGERMEHIAGNTVRFIGEHHAELSGLSVSQHLLKLWALVVPSAQRAIGVDFDNPQVVRPGILPALLDLLLNGSVVLHMGGIACVDRRVLLRQLYLLAGGVSRVCDSIPLRFGYFLSGHPCDLHS